MEKLKPCPFCGGRVSTTFDFANRWFFVCDYCGLIYRPNGQDAERESNKAIAIDAWNTRIDSNSEELTFTRRFIHDHGLEFALKTAWDRRANAAD